MTMPTRLTQTGAEVQEDLYKIEDIELATEGKAGLMSPEDKTKLDNIDETIPKKLSELEDDSTHRTVTDDEKRTWNNKSDFSGRYQDLTGRPFIPSKTSDLSNDSGFITRLVDNLVNYYLKSEVYTKAEVAALISSIQGFSVKVVDVLPSASAETMRAIYLVPSAEPQSGNIKDEWITVEEDGTYRWEQIGTTAINLDGYVTEDDLTEVLQGYVTSAAFIAALATKPDIRELKQAEYDALSDAEKNNGTIYFITDAAGGDSATFATGEKVKEVSITEVASTGSKALITSGGVKKAVEEHQPGEISEQDIDDIIYG